MTLAYSTISTALGPTDTSVSLTSATGVTVSNYQGAGSTGTVSGGAITYLLIEQEMVQLISGTNPYVIKRGMMGTRAMPHAVLTPFTFGTNNDFLNFVPATKQTSAVLPEQSATGLSASVVSAASIIASGPIFRTTGTTAMTNMLPPSSASLGNSGPNSEENYVNGTQVTIIFAGSAGGLTWTAAGGGTGPAFAVAGTATTALSCVTFILDGSSGAQLWYPSRLA
jgi:hypothetical protein